jgi:V-type H+-transporting ATPase subunit C
MFRFTVRDFTFDEKALAGEREKARELEVERQKISANLVRWLKINFGEIFSASIHIKALRVFAESVLRYHRVPSINDIDSASAKLIFRP